MVLVGIEADTWASVGAESFCPEDWSWPVVAGITAEAVAVVDDVAGTVSLIGNERKESEDGGMREKTGIRELR